jgi:hypothetical protein
MIARLASSHYTDGKWKGDELSEKGTLPESPTIQHIAPSNGTLLSKSVPLGHDEDSDSMPFPSKHDIAEESGGLSSELSSVPTHATPPAG